MRDFKLFYYHFQDEKRQLIKSFCILLIGCSLILINSKGITGIPLERKITPDEAKARYEEMKRAKEKIARELWEEKQKKKEEAEKKKQLMKIMELAQPTLPEEKLPAKKEEARGEIKEEIPPPAEELSKGIVPGVITEEEKVEQARKIEKEEKIAKEVKYKKDFSFILVIIVMLATIVFLIKSMYQGKPKDEKKKK